MFTVTKPQSAHANARNSARASRLSSIVIAAASVACATGHATQLDRNPAAASDIPGLAWLLALAVVALLAAIFGLHAFKHRHRASKQQQQARDDGSRAT